MAERYRQAAIATSDCEESEARAPSPQPAPGVDNHKRKV